MRNSNNDLQNSNEIPGNTMTHDTFNFLSEAELKNEVDAIGKMITFQKGDIIVQPEKYVRVIPLIIKGAVKVLRVDNSGNELLLYHIEAGQSCAASLSASLTDKISNIKAIAEEETELIAIPAMNTLKWFDKYPAWRMFVLKTIDHRFDEMLNTLDNVAFKKIDERLLTYLSAKSKAIRSNTINSTHQEIATELSTSREVVSRLLKTLEHQEKIRLFRNKIEIIKPL